MKAIVRASVALLGLLVLYGCGNSGGTCDGVTMQADMAGYVSRHLTASVTNSSEEPKLVSITVTNPQGELVATDGPFRVAAKNVTERDDIYYFGGPDIGPQTTVEELKSAGWAFNLKCQ